MCARFSRLIYAKNESNNLLAINENIHNHFYMIVMQNISFSSKPKYNLPMAVVNPGANTIGCLGISTGEGIRATSHRRPGEPDLFGSFSVRRCERRQRLHRSWINPVKEYFNQLLSRCVYFWSAQNIKRMTRRFLRRLGSWILEVEMGFVWGVAGLSIFIFVFAAIWYIDPALLTLVLRFKQATCKTASAAFLIGVSNCSWTSCKYVGGWLSYLTL